MTLDEVRTTALALMGGHGLLARGEPAAVRDTILHEIAHALAGHAAGHGPVWKGVCRRIGARPVRCGSEQGVLGGQTGKGAKFVLACPSCPARHYLFRRPKRTTGYHCRHCGPVKGRMTFGPAPRA